jgi:hypothetical protein
MYCEHLLTMFFQNDPRPQFVGLPFMGEVLGMVDMRDVKTWEEGLSRLEEGWKETEQKILKMKEEMGWE